MSALFRKCLQFVLVHEGGYSDDPADPGGPTAYGIASRWHDGAIDRDRAEEIYRREYWDPLRCAEMPPPVACAVFNFAVQHGPASAAMALQAIVGVRADGLIGPRTLAALGNCYPLIVARDLIARSTIDQSGSRNWERYRYGWTRRNLDCYAQCIALNGGTDDGPEEDPR